MTDLGLRSDHNGLPCYGNIFPIDEQTSHWRFKPGSYLASMIGHEGPGSLHSYLKERGWITTLSTGVQDLARGFATFKITLHLSQNGLP
jgi:insulysin